jgi:hypothetical protein
MPTHDRHNQKINQRSRELDQQSGKPEALTAEQAA